MLSFLLTTFPCFQQYGLIYRDRLYGLGLKASEISTIVNFLMATAALTGLFNGAMFRRFTFRQVAIAGAIFSTIGLIATAYCTTFIQFITFFSIVMGIGLGVNMSSTSLAVNTYFHNNRRKATGFSWTITGLGPIIFPHIVTIILYEYGFRGTVFIFAAVSMNAIVAGMVLQPVLRHVKLQPKPDEKALTSYTEPEYECRYCQAKKRKRSIFTSEYAFNDDDADMPGFEITEPGPPMLARANDGYYGSKMSLPTDANGPRRHQRHMSVCYPFEAKMLQSETSSRPNYFHREKEDMDGYNSKASIYSKQEKDDLKCTCAEEKVFLQKQIESERERAKEEALAVIEKPLTFVQKVVRFFDLNLLKDFTFVNLILGVTVILFGEMNFSLLSPFILNDFGYNNVQISTAMSLIGSIDMAVRFLSPFALENIKLDNKMLFCIGIGSIVIGRAVVAHFRNFKILLFACVLIGFGKGFRTIFAPLIIPSYVPLNRLPAASGLQLISNGIFTLAFAPVLGMVTDTTGYSASIHLLNLLTLLGFLSWLLEAAVRKFMRRKKEQQVKVNY